MEVRRIIQLRKVRWTHTDCVCSYRDRDECWRVYELSYCWELSSGCYPRSIRLQKPVTSALRKRGPITWKWQWLLANPIHAFRSQIHGLSAQCKLSAINCRTLRSDATSPGIKFAVMYWSWVGVRSKTLLCAFEGPILARARCLIRYTLLLTDNTRDECVFFFSNRPRVRLDLCNISSSVSALSASAFMSIPIYHPK